MAEPEQERPSKNRKGAATSRSIYVDFIKPIHVMMPPKGEIGSKLEEFLEWARSPVSRAHPNELFEIRDQWAGGEDALSEKYFPMPVGADPDIWEQNKRMLTHVNLVGTVVRTWVNAVYSDEPYRSVSGGAPELTAWLESDEFAQSMYKWAEYKVAYGEAVAVPRWDDERQELFTWVPDPCETVILRDPHNKRRVLGIAEVGRGKVEFCTVWGDGILFQDEYIIAEYDELEWLPAIVGGSGKTMVRDALTATYSACAILYNERSMQKNQTTSILVRMDELEKLKPVGGGKIIKNGDRSSIDLSDKGDAKFITPDPKIKESIDIYRQIISILATASGIPADVLDPSLTESASSAEGSRIRAIPYLQNSKPLMRAWRSDERNVVVAGQYLVELVKGKRPKYTRIKSALVIDIGLNTPTLPQSPNEETQDLIAAIAFGLTTPEDGVKIKHGSKSKKQIAEMGAEIKRRMKEESAQALAQKATGGGRPKATTGAGGSDNAEVA